MQNNAGELYSAGCLAADLLPASFRVSPSILSHSVDFRRRTPDSWSSALTTLKLQAHCQLQGSKTVLLTTKGPSISQTCILFYKSGMYFKKRTTCSCVTFSSPVDFMQNTEL
ncbi:hypothetical protein E3U43_005432 [Larimichthys crocea]|uniref:Uncharacterized protein n=1 Tax=Larimichthys crocea TaxID=215358 RepID=A0ACD3QLH8_LARCR|nr:hypothetical protein E3U43_005432 [Larimichthys crocea]